VSPVSEVIWRRTPEVMGAEFGELCLFDTRGWSMRRGHKQRLARFEGRESKRGRATFARSTNRTSRRDFSWERDRAPGSRRSALRNLTAQCVDEVVLEGSCLELDFDEEVIDVNAQRAHDQSPIEPVVEPLLAQARPHCRVESNEPLLLDPPPKTIGLLRQRSLPCTALENLDAQKRMEKVWIPLHMWAHKDTLTHVSDTPSSPATLSRPSRCFTSSRPCRPPTPWEMALDRANGAAAAYIKCANQAAEAYTKCANQAAVTRSSSESKQANHCKASTFDELSDQFLAKHQEKILQSIRSVFDGNISLTKAPLAQEVKDRFLQSYLQMNASKAHLRPTLHGTNARNHPSIFQKGLLVPGQRNDITVRNGLSHGDGVYTSALDSAWLSAGFCTEPRMLVCGVIDDASPVPRRPIGLGRLFLTAESEAIRHVGNAIIALQSTRVAPLYEAVGERFASPTQQHVSSSSPATQHQSTQSQPIKASQSEPQKCKAKKVPVSLVELYGRIGAFLLRRAARKRCKHGVNPSCKFK